MPNFLAREADGDTVSLPYTDPGRAGAAASKPVVLATEDKTVLDSLDTKLSTLAGYLDTVETLIGSTNTKLDTLAGHVDGLETLITATNTKLDAANASLDDIETQAESTSPVSVSLGGQGEYETVAASQTGQVLGATGASGDYLAGLLIVPATTSPGAVSIKDGSGGSAITVFTGGASSVSNLVPFFVPVGAFATSSGWRVTTGANVSVLSVGNFS